MDKVVELGAPISWLRADGATVAVFEARVPSTGEEVQVYVRGFGPDESPAARALFTAVLGELGLPPGPEADPDPTEALLAEFAAPMPDGWLVDFLGALRALWHSVQTRHRNDAGRLYAAPWPYIIRHRLDAVLACYLAHRALHAWWGEATTPLCPTMQELRRRLGPVVAGDDECPRVG